MANFLLILKYVSVTEPMSIKWFYPTFYAPKKNFCLGYSYSIDKHSTEVNFGVLRQTSAYFGKYCPLLG